MVLVAERMRSANSLCLLFGLSVLSCGPEKTSRPPVETPAKSAAAESKTPSAKPWVLSQKGILDLQLDAPLSPARLDPVTLQSQYETSFYADAQPLEGFNLSDPPVHVVVRDGPFTTFGMDHPGEPAPSAIQKEAVEAARQGKLKVSMLVVNDPRVKTDLEIGVGDDDVAFGRAYPNTPRKPMPALWEEPTCVAQRDGLWFFFEHCDEGRRAKIIRIVLKSADH